MDGRLPALLHLCDSLFPTGSYAHSDGLEGTPPVGIDPASHVRDWLDTLMEEILAHGDGPAVAMAWEHFTRRRHAELKELDDDLHALRPSSTGRDANRAVGSRLLKTWQRLHPDSFVESLTTAPDHVHWTLPVAFAVACGSIGVSQANAVEAFMYTRIMAVASAAMRLMPLGQLEAHALVASATGRIPNLAGRAVRRRELPGAFAPLADIAAMRQQYVGSRLFRS